MPLNWLTALKILPWSDMIEYAPKVVSGAQKVWQRVKNGKEEATVDGATTLLPSDPQTELSLLKHELQALQAQQLELTNVVKQLADQNQRLVDAVGVLRVRSRLLLLGFVLTACALLALWYTSH